jgi:phage FluMu gp28-like protein
MTRDYDYFLPYQIAWINDLSPLKLIEKSRQVGISFADAYDSVMKASEKHARLNVWISSRDEAQARLYLEDCKKWAELLELSAHDLGEVLFDREENVSAYALEFPTGRRIYSLSSNPNALAGKRGHVKLDEFALHHDQRLLYRVAKPVTTWGGQLSLISTHRGAGTVFNGIIRDIREGGNPMGWSLHSVPLQKAVEQGLVERINDRNGTAESREDFLKRLRAGCLDEEQWLQEYCCVPSEEATAFLSYELITSCEEPELKLLSFEELAAFALSPSDGVSGRSFYLGVDVARKNDLCVLDLGEKLGDVVWDRLRIELHGRTFSEIEAELYRLLRLPQVKRACLDATGMGLQLAERAAERFNWKVEPVTFTAAVKEELAFGLRADFEDRKVRLPRDERLRADLRGIKKEVTSSGNIRFAGETGDSHCDRFWAKALRQHAARHRVEVRAVVG